MINYHFQHRTHPRCLDKPRWDTYSQPRFKDARSKETPRFKDDFFSGPRGPTDSINTGVYTISTQRTPLFDLCGVLCSVFGLAHAQRYRARSAAAAGTHEEIPTAYRRLL